MRPPYASEATSVDLPTRIKLHWREDGAMEVSLPWKTLGKLLLFLVPAGACGSYGDALVQGTVRRMVGGGRWGGGRFLGYEQNAWLGYLLLGGSLLFSVALVYLSSALC